MHPNFSIDSFNKDSHQVPWEHILYLRDVECELRFLTDIVNMLFDLHCPIRMVRVTKPKAPQLTSNLKLIFKKRNKALFKFKSNPSPDNWSHYKYKHLPSDPTSRIEGQLYRILKKYKEHLTDHERTALTPHYSKPPHVYGLPKIHKDGIPLRPITSSRGSPTYNLAKHLLNIIQPLEGKTSSFVKDSKHFVEILAQTKLDAEDRLISFDIDSLYTNVPVGEALGIIQKRLQEDPTMKDRTNLPVNGVMELLNKIIVRPVLGLMKDYAIVTAQFAADSSCEEVYVETWELEINGDSKKRTNVKFMISVGTPALRIDEENFIQFDTAPPGTISSLVAPLKNLSSFHL
ncbi:unnamed protein product, partial [Callosobruchus maculatus]